MGFCGAFGGFFAPQEWKKGADWDARAELALLQPVWGGRLETAPEGRVKLTRALLAARRALRRAVSTLGAGWGGESMAY